MSAQILVVEDESAIRDMIRFALERHHYAIHTANNVSAARTLLASQNIELALIDWMLPGGSGLELVRFLRRNGQSARLPVIMLTARTEESDITAGLDAGADDYVTKPFSPRELHSRIGALLRRSQNFDAIDQVQRGPIRLEPAAHRVSIDGRPIPMGHTEFKLLAFLMQHPDRVYSRTQLLDHVWGPGTFIEERTVDVHILRLRKLLKPYGAQDMIETVRGAGYRIA
ncbi:MAG: phosphate regulon transcriptional regulator PhoB [Granulosicoccus sp.]